MWSDATPAIIKPIIPGKFNLFSRTGDSRMINKINENINTGLSRGNSNSCIKCLKKSVIRCLFSIAMYD